jgi:hypothetical protein
VILIIELIGVSLGLIALGVAFKHGLGLKEALKRLDKINKDFQESLGKINDELLKSHELISTQPLYEFPRYLQKITSLIAHAKRSVVVFCDTPAYGSFSEPRIFKEYKRQIIDKGGDLNVRVEIYCMNEDKRRDGAMLQFQEERFSEFKKQNKKKFEIYLNEHTKAIQHVTVDNLSWKEFIDLIAAEDTHTFKRDFACLQVSEELVDKPPIYFWYIDEAEMVFVIPSDPKKRLGENGFFTRDPHLINGILDVTERAFAKSAIKFTHVGSRQDLDDNRPSNEAIGDA